MTTIQEECVLVVPTREFRRMGYFQGFSREVERYLPALFDPARVSFRPRGAMERDPSYKQLIPYCIFQFRDAAGRIQLFEYTRGSGQGEARLHRKRSIGVGGHIATVDGAHAAAQGAYDLGLKRELEEEVHLDTPHVERVVGLINDDETDVGRVHLGVVHLFSVERPAVRPRETNLIAAAFRPLDKIRSNSDPLESWSQICLEALF